MAKWLKDLFNEYLQEQLEEDLNGVKSPVEIGGVYFGSLQSLSKDKPNKPLYFVVLRKMDDNLYEVMKASDWYHFATGRDVIVDLKTMKVIIETDYNFYLTEEEISRFRLIDKLDDEFVDRLRRFRNGEYVEIKKGFNPMSRFIDLGKDYKDIREAFKEEEFKQIREWHLRIFELLSEE